MHPRAWQGYHMVALDMVLDGNTFSLPVYTGVDSQALDIPDSMLQAVWQNCYKEVRDMVLGGSTFARPVYTAVDSLLERLDINHTEVIQTQYVTNKSTLRITVNYWLLPYLDLVNLKRSKDFNFHKLHR